MNRFSNPGVCRSGRLLVALLSAIFFAGFAYVSHAQTLYKWVDENGNISYQDQPPTGNQAVSQEVLAAPADTPSDADVPQSPEQSNPVVVYTVADCDACEILLLRLKQLGISNQEQSILDRNVQARILNVTERISAPTVFIGDKLVVDNSEISLMAELRSAGYQLPENSPVDTEDTQTESDDLLGPD